jgi:hypothetical protein
MVKKKEKVDKKPKKKKQKLSEKDKLILQKVTEDPEKPLNQIGNELVELGAYKHPGSVYRRLSQNAILKREISEVGRYHEEHLKREIYPKAAKRWEKALKDKELSHKEVFPYVKQGSVSLCEVSG